MEDSSPGGTTAVGFMEAYLPYLPYHDLSLGIRKQKGTAIGNCICFYMGWSSLSTEWHCLDAHGTSYDQLSIVDVRFMFISYRAFAVDEARDGDDYISQMQLFSLSLSLLFCPAEDLALFSSIFRQSDGASMLLAVMTLFQYSKDVDMQVLVQVPAPVGGRQQLSKY